MSARLDTPGGRDRAANAGVAHVRGDAPQAERGCARRGGVSQVRLEFSPVERGCTRTAKEATS